MTSGRSNLAAHDQRVAADNAARLEDLRWFAETGESLVGAAERLGLSVETLGRWCHRRGLHELWATLRARDPFDPNLTASERGRMGTESRRTA